MADHPHVLVDVTAAQAGRPSISVPGAISGFDPAKALGLSDDLRRAALTAAQLHDEFGDDRDPNRPHPQPTTDREPF